MNNEIRYNKRGSVKNVAYERERERVCRERDLVRFFFKMSWNEKLKEIHIRQRNQPKRRKIMSELSSWRYTSCCFVDNIYCLTFAIKLLHVHDSR